MRMKWPNFLRKMFDSSLKESVSAMRWINGCMAVPVERRRSDLSTVEQPKNITVILMSVLNGSNCWEKIRSDSGWKY